MSGAMAVDTMCILYSLLGGFFMGSYPAAIKLPSVMEVQAHPVIFQSYKSFWVFVTGWIFVLGNALSGRSPVFEFTWWGVVATAAWIPSGLCTIYAVPRLGVGLTMVISTGTAATMSFLAFWLLFGEQMRIHVEGTHHFYLAPAYLLCVVLGMFGLVAASQMHKHDSCLGIDDSEIGALVPKIGRRQKNTTPFLSGSLNSGLAISSLGGIFSAVQFAAVNLGKRLEMQADGCAGNFDACSPVLQERFNSFGSWMSSFGIGAILITLCYVALVFGLAHYQGAPLPSLHFRTLRGPGSVAGLCWSIGAMFQTAAVVRGGNAVMVPANGSIQLITTGLWSVLYYGEVRGTQRLMLWAAAAFFTLAAMFLLSGEKLDAPVGHHM